MLLLVSQWENTNVLGAADVSFLRAMQEIEAAEGTPPTERKLEKTHPPTKAPHLLDQCQGNCESDDDVRANSSRLTSSLCLLFGVASLVL